MHRTEKEWTCNRSHNASAKSSAWLVGIQSYSDSDLTKKQWVWDDYDYINHVYIYNTPLHTKHQFTVKSNLTFHLCERIIQHWPLWPVHPFPYTPCQWRMAGSTWRYVRTQGRGRTASLNNSSTETPTDLHLSSSQLHLRQTLSNFKLGTSSALQCRFRCLSSCALFGNKVWGK